MHNRKYTKYGDVVILSDVNCIFLKRETHGDPMDRQFEFIIMHYKRRKKQKKYYTKKPRIGGGLYQAYNPVFFSINEE